MATTDATALCTLPEVVEYLGDVPGEDHQLLGSLINRVSDRIEAYCDRTFSSATYREWHDGRRQRVLKLKHRPVTAITRMAYGSATALTVTATTSTDLRATVEVQDAQLVLTRYDSSGTVAATSLAFTTYPTASDLATQISATTGWSATVSTNCLSLDLHRQGGVDAKTRTISLTFPDSSDVQYDVNETAGLVTITSRPTAYWPREDEASFRFPSGYQNLLVEYTAGYSTIPGDLVQATIEMVRAAYASRTQNPMVASESLGDYSYTLANQVEFDERIRGMLAYYLERP